MIFDQENFYEKIKLRPSFESHQAVWGIPSKIFVGSSAISLAGIFYIGFVFGILNFGLFTSLLYVLYRIDPDYLIVMQDKLAIDSRSNYEASDEFQFKINLN
jgi:hypothetical protein